MPAISNLTTAGLSYLREVLRLRPNVSNVSVQRYGDGDFQTAHPGFVNRYEEILALKRIIGARPSGCSEFAYSAHLTRFARWSWGLSDLEAAAHITSEWQFWPNVGAAFAVLYQLNDASAANNRYGIRRADGSLKSSG